MSDTDFSATNQGRTYKIKDNGKVGGNFGLYLRDESNNENLIGFIHGKHKAMLVQRLLNGNDTDIGGAKMVEAIQLDNDSNG